MPQIWNLVDGKIACQRRKCIPIIPATSFIMIMTALTIFRMIQRVVETLPSKFAAMLSHQQIEKDINISMCALTVVFKCLEVPQVSSLNDVRCYVNV
jgi:hypothetical protein